MWGLTAWVCMMVSMSVYNQYPEYKIDYIEDRSRPPKEVVTELVDRGSLLLNERREEAEEVKSVPTDVSREESKI